MIYYIAVGNYIPSRNKPINNKSKKAWVNADLRACIKKRRVLN